MLFLRSWLEEYINLSGISNQQLAELITTKSSEVEEVREIEDYFGGKVLVGRIENVRKHDQADRLKVFEVNLGNSPFLRGSGGKVQIVSAAPNVKEGMLVPVALEGCKLPFLTITPRKMRGIESQGMCCGKSELMLETQMSEGLWEITVESEKLKVKSGEVKGIKSPLGGQGGVSAASLIFRRATLADISGILAVQKKSMIDAFVGDQYGITLEMVEQSFVGQEDRMAKYFETTTYFVAEIEKQIVGVSAAVSDRIIRTMWVDPDFQSRGIGKQLMLMAIKELGDFEDIKLETGLQKNGQAINFYQKLGFEKTGKESKIKFFPDQSGEVENIEFVLKKQKIKELLQPQNFLSQKKVVLMVHGGTSLGKRKAQDVANWPIQPNTYGGSWGEKLDEVLAEDFEVLSPLFPEANNAIYAEWKQFFERLLTQIGNKDLILIGHSLGSVFLQKYLAENDLTQKVEQLHLVGACLQEGDFRSSSNWQNLSKQCQNIHIWHSKDDGIVPFQHGEVYHKNLSKSQFHVFEDRGHFEQAEFGELIFELNKMQIEEFNSKPNFDQILGQSVCKVFPELFPLETVMDIKVLPDRIAQIGNHLGMALEIAICLENLDLLTEKGKRVLNPELIKKDLKNFENNKENEQLKVEFEDQTGYTNSFNLYDLKLEKEFILPHQMQKRMLLLEKNLIGGLADLSNYLLYDMGQPTHFFSKDKVLNLK